MSKLKVKLLTGRSGNDGSNLPGDTIELDAKEAVALVKSEQAQPINKKLYEDALASLSQRDNEEREREAKANAIMQREVLELELKDLYRQVALKHAQLEGVILDDISIEEFVTLSLEGEKFKEEKE